MGDVVSQSLTNSSKSDCDGNESDELWPWEWALLNPEELDWKTGLSTDQINSIHRKQTKLPALVLEPYLYIADAKATREVGTLKAMGITHVINAAGKVAMLERTHYEALNIEFVEFDAEDEDSYPILEVHLKTVLQLIERVKSSRGRCVINCAAGLNRSGVLVAAVLILIEKMDVCRAVKTLRKARGNMALCNRGFQQQLVRVAQENCLLGSEPGTSGSVALNTAPLDRKPRISRPPLKQALDSLCN